jgi:hypothetical protein
MRSLGDGRTMAAKVFISYRRDDSAGHAGRVHDRLVAEFGRDLLFMDVDAIPLGVNFIKVLRGEVAKCDVLLAVIGPHWLNARNEEGERRLDSPNDFVRIEIATALQRDIPVIPILLDGARIPQTDQLPEDLQELALRNGLDVRHASFHRDMDKLIRSLKEPGECSEVNRGRSESATRQPIEDELRARQAKAEQHSDEEKLLRRLQEQARQPADELHRRPEAAARPRAEPNEEHQQSAEAPAPWQANEDLPRRSLMKMAISAAMVAAIAGLLLWQWPNMVAIYGMLWAPPAEVVNDNPPATKPKITDRIEPGAASDVAAVAPRAFLFEEDPNDPQGKRAVGSVNWRTETLPLGAGKPPELAVVADIEIPERKMSIAWTLRRDTDPGGFTSHTIEVMFKLPPDFPAGDISDVSEVWMKQAEQAQGTALAGLSVKVTTGYFLFGLSAASADKERNIQLLKERPWFDITFVYANNRRASLSMEKGTPGERVFAQAFAAWDSAPAASTRGVRPAK